MHRLLLDELTMTNYLNSRSKKGTSRVALFYALTDISQKLGIPKIQFTDHMKLNKKEDQTVDGPVLLLKGGTKYSQGNIGTKSGAETEGKAI